MFINIYIYYDIKININVLVKGKMYLTLPISSINNRFIFYNNKIKNNVFPDSIFTRLLYSTPHFTMNGIFCSVVFKILKTSNSFGKNKCFIDTSSSTSNSSIAFLKKIEYDILTNYANKNEDNIGHRTPVYSLTDNLHNNKTINVFNNITIQNENTFILKIFGIWETNNHYGLTYKFVV